MLKVSRRLALPVVDIAAALVSTALAFVVRFAFDQNTIPDQFVQTYLHALPILLIVQVAVYFAFGLYGQIWAYAGVNELLRIVGAVTLETAVGVPVIYLVSSQGYPRSVIVISALFRIGLVGFVRLAARLRRDLTRAAEPTGNARDRTLIYGAGDAGAMLVREYAKHPELGCEIVGFIDDDHRKRGLKIAGKPILGTRSDLADLIVRNKVKQLVVAMPSVRGATIREIMALGSNLGLHLKTLPGLYELVDGKVTVQQLRDIRLEDILGREQVQLDVEEIAAFLQGETVLVTGAGGSIGSELCRHIARFRPRQLLILGHGENSIYEIEGELRRAHPDLAIGAIIADIQDAERIRWIMQKHRPAVVFHAAAHKHVPLMEQNPGESIKNNVFGTLNVARASHEFGVRRFVLISSDKAVNPTSVMGATKRAAELVLLSIAARSQTKFVSVRFGNVLGSRGSVVPLFMRQIAAGGPVTVTDPKMVRYFMTIPEAVQLVIQAAAMGRGGEVFVLDMGSPVRIVDLARDLIRLSGHEPDVDIQIAFTGMRAGEKLFEELLTAEEGTSATKHERIFVARTPGVTSDMVDQLLGRFHSMLADGSASNDKIREVVGHVLRVASMKMAEEEVAASARLGREGA